MKNEEIDRRNYINFKISKAHSSLKAAKLMCENSFYNEAISRAYYACFYVVTALLYKNNIPAKTHSGVKNMFHLHFIQTGKLKASNGTFFSRLFDYRNSSDYDDFSDFERQMAEGLINESDDFISAVKILIGE